MVYQCLFVGNRTKPSIRRLWVHWALAGRAVKVAADNLKAFRNAIHSGIPSIGLRKPGNAGLSTDGTPKIFSPTVEDDHPSNMTLRRDRSTPPVAEHLGSSAEFAFRVGNLGSSNFLCLLGSRGGFRRPINYRISLTRTVMSAAQSGLYAPTTRPQKNTPGNSSMVKT